MPRQYRRKTPNVVEVNQKYSYAEHEVDPARGNGTKKVNDRYHVSRASYATPNPGYPFPHVTPNELWQQPYVDPLHAVTLALQQPYGSRYRVAGIGSSPNKIVVIQNPTGPLEPTDRGYRTVEANARLGSFLAQMNAASVARRRRRG